MNLIIRRANSGILEYPVPSIFIAGVGNSMAPICCSGLVFQGMLILPYDNFILRI